MNAADSTSNPPAFAIGFGIGTKDSAGSWLEVFYAHLQLEPGSAVVNALGPWIDNAAGQPVEPDSKTWHQIATCLDEARAADWATSARRCAESLRPTALVVLTEDAPPASTPEAYLKLQLLSHRLATPHSLNLDGIFVVLPNVAWTNQGAISAAELGERQLQARLQGQTLHVYSVDKFPPMADYVVPSGVRSGDASRVRLGAHVGDGTTVMHEGFINFNAGTLGQGMIEGRISAGVTVGDGSDLGGSASTMGTLSGGGKQVIRVGERCLLGANSGIGIPLGDRCTIEAGLYITAGTKVTLITADGSSQVVRARDLAGQSDLLFLRNSQTGAVEARTNRKAVELNAALHRHN